MQIKHYYMRELGQTGEDYDAWIAMGGGGEGSSFSAWYGFGGRAGMSLDDYFAANVGLSIPKSSFASVLSNLKRVKNKTKGSVSVGDIGYHGQDKNGSPEEIFYAENPDDRPTDAKEDYRANLETSKDPLHDIVYAYAEALNEYGNIETLYNIVIDNNYSNCFSCYEPVYTKIVKKGGHKYKIRVQAGDSNNYNYIKTYNNGSFGYLDKYSGYPKTWKFNDGYAFGFVIKGIQKNYLMSIGANTSDGYYYLKQYFFEMRLRE